MSGGHRKFIYQNDDICFSDTNWYLVKPASHTDVGTRTRQGLPCCERSERIEL